MRDYVLIIVKTYILDMHQNFLAIARCCTAVGSAVVVACKSLHLADRRPQMPRRNMQIGLTFSKRPTELVKMDHINCSFRKQSILRMTGNKVSKGLVNYL